MAKKIITLLFCLLLATASSSAVPYDGVAPSHGVATFSRTPANSGGPKRYQAEFLDVFDTVTTLVGYATSKEEFTAIAVDTKAKLQEYHRLFDVYNDYDGLNNLKTVNDSAGQAPVAVDPRILDLLELAKQKYDLTGGAVNIALGAVTALWHDAREAGIADPEHAALPSMAALRAAAAHTDIADVVMDRTSSTVYLRDPALRLDAGAVAKGYAAEQTALYLEAKGLRHLLLSVGGNVRAIGCKPDASGLETPWVVAIANPDKSSDRKTLFSVLCDGGAVVTSGGCERYFTVNGLRYHHIVNPETLMPARYYRSVTLICRDSAFADGLTTALFNMPLAKGRHLVNALDGVAALWVLPDGTCVTSPGFDNYLVPEAE